MPQKALKDQVFDLDPNIRYCALVDQFGEFLEGGMRPGIKSITPKEDDRKMLVQTALARGMAKTWESYFGAHKFSMIAHEKLVVLRFPLGKKIMIITAEPEMSLDVTRKIEDILKVTA